jgi:3-methyladenine DNA glycosylase AlkD
MKFCENEIFDIFRNNADPEKAVPMAAYMRDQFPYLGIPTPERKELSRAFMKTADKKVCDWDFVFKCWEMPEREFQYLALDYLEKHKKLLGVANIPKLRQLAVIRVLSRGGCPTFKIFLHLPY